MRLLIKNMTEHDINPVGEILYKAFNSVASQHGYPPKMQSIQVGRSWAWALLHHGPSELLIAEVEKRLVGICCLNPRGDIGGVGPVAVDPDFQGHNIGRELMVALIKKADGLQSLRLFQEAFNPASFSLYYSLKFMPVTILLELFLKEGIEQSLDSCSNVYQLEEKDLNAVTTYDSSRSKLDRRTDLAYYVKWGKVFVYQYQSQIQGFLACLPSSESLTLGPLLAEGEKEAEVLFRHALAVYRGRDIRTRVMAKDYLLVEKLKELGFKLYCVDNLMVLGTWRPCRYVEGFGIFPEGI